jgi:hypothetical protein
MLVRILALLFGALGFISLFNIATGANKWGAWGIGLAITFFFLYGLLRPRLLSKLASMLVDRGEAREAVFSALESLPSLPFSQLLLINATRTMMNPLLIVPIVLASVAVAWYCQFLLEVPRNLQSTTMLLIWMASLFLLVMILAFLKTLIQRQRRDQAKDVNP